MSLRAAAIEAVGALEYERADGPTPTIPEYVDTVLGVVVGRLESVVRELHATGALTSAGAAVVHHTLDKAGITA